MNAQKLRAVFRLFTLEILLTLAVFAGALTGFLYLAHLVFVAGSSRLDQAVFHWVAGWVTPGLTRLMEFFSLLASTGFLVTANLLLTLYFLFIRRHRWYAMKIPAIALTNTAVLFLLKSAFRRPRPLLPLLYSAEGFSFPSGHSMSGCCFYGLLLYILWQQRVPAAVKWLATFVVVVLIVCIGLSRIYLRVHYVSDVLAGFSMGLAWLVFSLWLLNRLERGSSRQ